MNPLLRNSALATSRVSSARLAQSTAARCTRRTVMTLKDAKYTAHATARGQGRNGEVISDDDSGLKLRLAMPKSLGGKGDGQNPEQLFAMGYAACFLSAMQMVAGQRGSAQAAKDVAVHASVHIGEPEDGEGFGLAVDIHVEGVDDQALIDAGHEACPYSRALKHGAVVKVSKGTGSPSSGAAGSTKSADETSDSNSSSGSSSSSSSSGSSKPDGIEQSGTATAGYQ